MTSPPFDTIGPVLALIKELSRVDADIGGEFTGLDPAAQAVKENTLALREGIDPKSDLVSIPGTMGYLRWKLYAAREHLLGSLWLLGLDDGRGTVNPVQALARCSVEASAACLWLCSNNITWEQRLRRFSQLHLASICATLKAMGIDPYNPPDPSIVHQDIKASIEDCNALIDWVTARGWTCTRGKKRGKAPTIASWADEVPGPSALMNEASAVVAFPAEALRLLYASYSGSVHSNPVTVIGGSTEEEFARLACAHRAVGTGATLYGLAWKLFASWCAVPYPDDVVRDSIAALGE